MERSGLFVLAIQLLLLLGLGENSEQLITAKMLTLDGRQSEQSICSPCFIFISVPQEEEGQK